MPGRLALGFAVLLLGAPPAPISAAPPSVTHLFPGGAQRGTTVEVTAGGSFDAWPPQVWSDRPGITLEPAKAKGKFTVKVPGDAVPGIVRFRFHTPDGASPIRPFQIGTLPDVLEKEPNDEPKTAQPVANSVVVNGQLGKNGDVDCFAISLKRGETLVASLAGHEALNSPMDAMLQIVSADGFVLETNNDFHGLDPQIVFPAPRDGTYIVRVHAFPSQPDASIRFAGGDAYVYRLTLTTAGFLDFATPLAVQKPTDPIRLEGWNIPADVKPMVVDSPTGSATLTLFHPKLANLAHIRREPHPTFPNPPTIPPTPPFSVTGHISKPDGEATIPFSAKKGEPLLVQVQSRTLGLDVNPMVRILDPSQKPVARGEQQNPNTDIEVSLRPAVDGIHTVTVRDLFSRGGARHHFLLRVVPAKPDFELTLTSDRFTVPAEKTVEIPVKIQRLHGFSKAIEYSAEGLPADVKLTVKPSTGKPDPNSATLVITAGKTPISMNFRILGHIPGEPGQSRSATAVLADPADRTSDLWLTVTGPAGKK